MTSLREALAACVNAMRNVECRGCAKDDETFVAALIRAELALAAHHADAIRDDLGIHRLEQEAAFRRGAEAMRTIAGARCRELAKAIWSKNAAEAFGASWCAAGVEDLPLPEMKT